MAATPELPPRVLSETYFLHETRNFSRDMGLKGWTPAEISRKDDETGVVASYVMKNSTLCVVSYALKSGLPKEMVYIVAPSDSRKKGDGGEATVMTASWRRDIVEVLAVVGAQLFEGHAGMGSPLHEEMLRQLGPDHAALKIDQSLSMELPGRQVRLEAQLLQNPLAWVLKVNSTKVE